MMTYFGSLSRILLLEPKNSTSVALNLVQKWFGLETLRYPPRKMKFHSVQYRCVIWGFWLQAIEMTPADMTALKGVGGRALRPKQLERCRWQESMDDFLQEQP